jgi:Xaa-Pro dipeptidase
MPGICREPMNSEYKRFPKIEHEKRWEGAGKSMAGKGLDALLITGTDNFTYFSGGHGDLSFSRPTFMLLFKDDDPVVMVHDFFEASQRKESWVADIRTYSAMQGPPMDLIKSVFREKALDSARIGAELGIEQRLGLSYNDFVEIKKGFPNACFMDASDLLWMLRMVKSPMEIDCIRKACDITGRAFEKSFKMIREGMTEKEATGIMAGHITKAGGSQAWVVANSGPYNYDSGFLTVSGNHRLVKGNLFWMDSGCKFNGYASDFSRMAAIGAPSDRQKKVYEQVDTITRRTVEGIRPGVTAADLSRLCSIEFEKAGLKDLWGDGDCSSAASNRAQRIGHGIGMAYTEMPHIAIYDHTVLKPGMSITIEPTVVTHYGHFHIEEDVLVTEDGYEVLSKASRELLMV